MKMRDVWQFSSFCSDATQDNNRLHPTKDSWPLAKSNTDNRAKLEENSTKPQTVNTLDNDDYCRAYTSAANTHSTAARVDFSRVTQNLTIII